MSLELRYKIEVVEIDFDDITYKYISTNLPIEAVNEYYGYKPLIKNVDDIPTEIKEKDTIARRLKVTLIDELDYIDSTVSTNMASYWRLFIARNKNYKGKLIRYYRRLGDGALELKFTGRLENIKIASNGNVTIEAVDLLKAMSKVDYPLMAGCTLAEDLPAVFTINSASELISLSDAVAGDYANETHHTITLTLAGSLSGAGDLPGGTYYFKMVAFNSYDEPIDESDIKSIVISSPANKQIGILWNAAFISTIADYYRLYGYTEDLEYIILETTNPNTGYAFIGGSFDPTDNPPAFKRYRKLKVDGDPTSPDYESNWLIDFPAPSPFIVDIEGNINNLADHGYVKINDEIIYYESITTDSEGASLIGVLRGQLGTESPRSLASTMLYVILSIDTPIDIFLQMKNLLYLAGLDDNYISTKFDDYIAENILDVTTLPIAKSTKLSNIYFDLVNLADCISFENEDGLIEIIRNTEIPETIIEITDEANLIYNTIDVDLNESSRYTRWVLLWNRIDIDKSLTDDDAYLRGNITVDGDAEDYYGDVLQDKQYTTFINVGEDELEIEAANLYINDLLNNRRLRTSQAQLKLSSELEIKDDTIKIGQIVKIKTQKVINEDGVVDFNYYRVIKKEPGFNKIKFTFLILKSNFGLPLIAKYDNEDIEYTAVTKLIKLVDSSGNGYDFETNTPTDYYYDGALNGLDNAAAWRMSVNINYFIRTTDDFFNSKSFTFFIAFMLEETDDDGCFYCLRGQSDTVVSRLLIDTGGTNGALRAFYRDVNNVELSLSGSNENPLSLDTWYILVINYNDITKTLKSVVNGTTKSVTNVNFVSENFGLDNGETLQRLIGNRTLNGSTIDAGANRRGKTSDQRIYGSLTDKQINFVADEIKTKLGNIPLWSDL